MNDLFGQPVVEQVVERAPSGRKSSANGYPAPPGTGPVGETCKTCEHKIKVNGGNKDYWKCHKFTSPSRIGQKWQWSGCTSSDIRLKAPACRLWEPALSKTPRPLA